MSKSDRMTEGMRVLRSAVSNVDIVDLLARQNAMADVLARIARREEYENPVTAIRAASSAARVLSDTVAGVVVEERLAALQAVVDEMNAERQRTGTAAGQTQTTPDNPVLGRSAISNQEIRLPNWGYTKKPKTNKSD